MRVGIVLAALAAAQLAAALVGQLIVLRLVGVGQHSDAYIAAQAVPMVLTAVVAASLQSLWLPRFARASAGGDSLVHEQSIAQGQALKLLLGMALVIGCASPWWTHWLFPGFAPDLLDLVVHLGAPLLAASVLNAQSGLLTAGLRAQGRFFGTEIATLAGTLAAITLILVFVPSHGIHAASYITLARAFGVYLVQMSLSSWPGLVFRRTEASREVWRQMRALIAGSSFIKTGPLVDRYWSSQSSQGGVTVLNIAQLCMNSLASIFERAFIVPTVPEFSRRLQNRDLDGLLRAYHRVLWRMAGTVAVIGVLLLAAWPVWSWTLHVLLRIGDGDSRQIWLACLLLVPALYVSVCGSAAVAVFYAFGETTTPVTIGLAGFITSLVVKGALFHYFGILGIAAGASIYLSLNMVAYHWAVHRRVANASHLGARE